ncbi:MAG: NOG1 family protein [Promethearchaeota archaeon]
MGTNPFERINKIITADELIEIAFRKADSRSASLPKTLSKIMRSRRKEINKIQNINKYILKRIKDIIQSFPNFDELHPFHKELVHLLVNIDRFRILLGKLNGIIPILTNLEREISRKIKLSEEPGECAALRRQFFARVSSIIKKQAETFEELEKIRRELKKIPAINVTLPSIVISGYPNVGKSSLVANISSARPEICEYPFTTKNIIIGVYRDEYKSKLFQIIDTPGILDRPMSKRNVIEKQAILALRTISNIIIFMIDPTLSCGYPIESQIALFKEIKENFIDYIRVPWLILINKIDIADEKDIQYVINELNVDDEHFMKICAKDGPFDEFIDRIKYIIKKYRLIDEGFKKFK